MIYPPSTELNGHEFWHGELLIDCPDCGNDQFYSGPEAAGSINFKCVVCGSEFNEMGQVGFHRIND